MPVSVDSLSMSDRRTSTSSLSPNAFPRPAGAELVVVPEPNIGQPSPQKSVFSFEDTPRTTPPSRTGEFDINSERKEITRDIAYGAPGEKPDMNGQFRSRRRTRYFEDQFGDRNNVGSARERVANDSPVVAELKTNVIIKDEYSLITDLSYHLSTRYHRPESSIMISINHSACLLLGGTFDPAYVLDITALPSQVQPATNKRNAALVQLFMSDILSVAPDRGILRFHGLPEESLAINGKTILGEIEALEKQQAEENGTTLKRGLTKGSRKSFSMKPKKSLDLKRMSTASQYQRAVITPPIPSPPIPSPGMFDSGFESGFAADSRPTSRLNGKVNGDGNALADLSTDDSKVNRHPSRQLKQKKSAPNLGTTTGTALPAPPPVPEDKPTPKVSKRKSLIAMFSRKS